MDAREYVRILQTQRDQLQTLAAQLAARLEHIAQALREPHVPSSAEVEPIVDGLIKVSASLRDMADILHKRLVAFRGKIQRDKDPLP